MTGPGTRAAVSICVTHYRSPDDLWRCLASIDETLSEVPHEVCVADSAATSQVAQRIGGAHPSVRYLPFPANVGFARLVNAGLAWARAEHVIILNADTRLRPGTVPGLIRVLSDHPDVGLVGPRLIYEDGNWQRSAFRYHRPLTVAARRTRVGASRWGRAELDRFEMHDLGTPNGDGPVAVDWLMGAAWAVRGAAAAEVGPLDEGYFLYFEDVDWCRRFWEAGWKVVWQPDVEVVHAYGRSSGGSAVDVLRNPYVRTHIRSAVRYFAKFGLDVPQHGV